MQTEKQDRRSDAVLMGTVFAVSAVFLTLATSLPPSRFDPLGPASFPIGICVLLLLFSAVGGLRLLLGQSLGKAETSLVTGVGEEVEYKQHPWLAVSLYLGTALYVLVLQFAPIDFIWVSIVYLLGAGLLLSRNLKSRTIVIALAVAVSASAVLTLIFTRLLVVALP